MDKVKICNNHDYEVPLIGTISFRGAECWCPYCGQKYGMFNGCDKVDFTGTLKKRLKFYEDKYEGSKKYLHAVGWFYGGAVATEIDGKRYDQCNMPKEIEEQLKKALSTWIKHEKAD
jgi:hypothetical protein